MTAQAFLGGRVVLHAGDCIDVMRAMPEASVDAVVTDPPYGLEFMGKDWDVFAPKRKNASVWNGRRQGQEGWEENAASRSGKGGGGPSYRSSHYKGSRRCSACGKRQFSGTPCQCDDPQWVIEHRQEAPSAMLGTTGEAAFLEGFSAILIEREAEYCADIERRMAHVREPQRVRKQTIIKARGKTEGAGPLFGGNENA